MTRTDCRWSCMSKMKKTRKPGGLSADEKKRLEYETRQRAIRDYNIGMLTAERRGIENGRKIGIEEGRAEINQLILELSKLGRTEDITKAAADKEYQRKLLKEFGLH